MKCIKKVTVNVDPNNSYENNVILYGQESAWDKWRERRERTKAEVSAIFDACFARLHVGMCDALLIKDEFGIYHLVNKDDVCLIFMDGCYSIRPIKSFKYDNFYLNGTNNVEIFHVVF